jgi:hypothetical protein
VSRIPLIGGAYQARSIIASAQRSLNIFAEQNPQDSPTPFSYYPCPGTRLLGASPNNAGWRGLYAATNNKLYGVSGNTVYAIGSDWSFSSIGTIGTSSGVVSMDDNATTIALVDGSTSGYAIDLASTTMTNITGDAFYGADRVAYIDTYFLFNKPGTPQFYSSDSNSLTFDSLWFANKVAYADHLVTLAVAHREIWLLGQTTSEVWIDAGAPQFPFQAMQGVFIDYGCAAKHSVARVDNALFWLGRDRSGQGIVLRGAAYEAKRISTFAIENAIADYGVISDAIGYTYQQRGHVFYRLIFPRANKAWGVDISTDPPQWHELAWIDDSGVEHRHRGNCHAFCYGVNVVGDWQNGNLYALDMDVYTDNGSPIKRVRGFPHLVQDGKRVSYRQFIADMEVGRATGELKPFVSLRWSDDRGASWGNPVMLSLGAPGEYLTSMQAQRLGIARDRVFELSWSSPVRTALNGAFVDARVATS